MRTASIAMTAVIAFAGMLSSALASPGHGAHEHSDHRAFAAGEPGDPKRVSRIVHIAMRESEDGKMSFAPAELNFRKGEQVKFVLRNVGKIEHEFVLDSPQANAEHKAEMAKNPVMEHNDPTAKHVNAAKTGSSFGASPRRASSNTLALSPDITRRA